VFFAPDEILGRFSPSQAVQKLTRLKSWPTLRSVIIRVPLGQAVPGPAIDHADGDPRLAARSVVLFVVREPPIPSELGEGPLPDPSPLHRLESGPALSLACRLQWPSASELTARLTSELVPRRRLVLDGTVCVQGKKGTDPGTPSDKPNWDAFLFEDFENSNVRDAASEAPAESDPKGGYAPNASIGFSGKLTTERLYRPDHLPQTLHRNPTFPVCQGRKPPRFFYLRCHN